MGRAAFHCGDSNLVVENAKNRLRDDPNIADLWLFAMEKPTADGEARAAQLPILVVGSGKRRVRRIPAHGLTHSQEPLDSHSLKAFAKYVLVCVT